MKLRSLVFAVAVASAFSACNDGENIDPAPGTGGSAGSSGKGGSGGSDAGQGGSGGSDAGQGGESAIATDAVSKEITAEEGGEVANGDATLSIPAGALPGDTTVTIETSAPSNDLPDAASVKGLVYDFGPDGTEFTEPVALTLPSAGQPGADEEAVIAWLDEERGAWQDLVTTVNADGSLSAEITHFTKFAVRFNGVEQNDCGFSACGGDVVGTWTVTGACAKADVALEDVCPTAVGELELNLSGSATFAADGTRTTDFTSKVTITYTLDAQCMMAATGGTLPASCSDLDSENDPKEPDEGPTTCTGTPSVSCTCVQAGVEKTETKTGTYTVDGNQLTSIDDEDGESDTAEFCVNGDDARFQSQEELAVLTWIAKRH